MRPSSLRSISVMYANTPRRVRHSRIALTRVTQSGSTSHHLQCLALAHERLAGGSAKTARLLGQHGQEERAVLCGLTHEHLGAPGGAVDLDGDEVTVGHLQ